MKKLSYLGIIVLFTFAVVGCGNSEQQGAGSQRQTPTLPVAEVGQKTIQSYREYPATLEGVIHSSIRSKVSGYITEVMVEEGEKVNKGQTLFTIETNALSQDAAAAKASIEAAKVEVDRLKPLVEKDIVSEVQLKTAKSKLAQARANFKSISSSIDYAQIKSSVNGHVGEIHHREGALVSPADQKPLTYVSVVDSLFAFFGMNEEDYLNFLAETAGKTLDDKVAHFPKVKFKMINDSIYGKEGRIKTVSGQVNRQSGSVKFTAIFPNPNHLLSTGGSGEVLIPKEYKNVTVVPEVATYEQQGNVYAFKVGKDGKVTSTIIDVVDRLNGYVISKGGIEKGDKIIIQGLNKVSDQMTIKPKMISMDSIPEIKKVFK